MTWKPVLTLIALTSLLPELLSGSTPLEAWAAPQVLPLFILGYGVPILVIRELAIRRDTGAFGIFLMGLGYGVINEGFFAGTLFRETGVPIPFFDHYGFALGVSWPWAAVICAWHAVTSVWLPIAVTERLHGRDPWLPRWALVLAGLITLGLPSLVFLWRMGSPAMGALVAQWAVILAVVGLGLRVARQGADSRARGFPLVLGFLGGLGFVASLIPAGAHLPPLVQVAALTAIVALFGWIIRRRGLAAPYPVGWFALGWYVSVAVFAATHVIFTSPITLAADLLALCLLGLLVWRGTA
jgi:hypothetical protein